MFEDELIAALEAAKLARIGILEVYNSTFDVEIKNDNSPVTIADKNADKEIREYLHNKFPSYSFLTEESTDDLTRLNNDYVWIIDPVDGTKEFVNHIDEFTTNIALAYKGEIVVGVIARPLTDEYWYATKNGGAFHRKNNKDTRIHVSKKTSNLTCLISVFHLQDKEIEVINKFRDIITSTKKVGAALKSCFIAEGLADISYRLADGTKEWDIAPCHLLIKEAGGLFLKPDLTEYTYNKKDVYNHEGYIITNNKKNILF